MTEPAAEALDRQQRLRDRQVDVEAQLAKEADKVAAETKASIATADKLEKQRKALHVAEQEHGQALLRLQAAESEQSRLEGELASINRRLEFGAIVRKERA